MNRKEIDKSKLSPMMIQYMEIKASHEDTIVFFRLGDFYEMFFEDAILVSHELELTLTGKNAGLKERIPMCGVPHHAANIYIAKLVENGHKLAICEQVEQAGISKGIVKREVVNIISKGVNLSNEILTEENTFLGAVTLIDNAYIISYIDITTGEFFLTHTKSDIIKTIVDLNLKELVVSDEKLIEEFSMLKKNYGIQISLETSVLLSVKYDNILNDLNQNEKNNAHILLSYLDNNLKKDISHLKKCIIINTNDFLFMDLNCKNNLDLVLNNKLKSTEFTLFSHLNKTKTSGGKRKLKYIIEHPLTNINEINDRYYIIEVFNKNFLIREELRELLYDIYDLDRICAKLSYGNVNARDLIWLKNSLFNLPYINNLLNDLNFNSKFEIENFENLYELLNLAIFEDAGITIKEGNIIKEGFNETLDEYKKMRLGSKDFILNLEKQEKERTGINNLKIKFNKIFGYFIEISKSNIHLVKEEFGYERKQTLANCERYVTPLLKEKENLILSLEDKIINLEYELFIEIREKIKEYINKIQKTSENLSYLDVMLSFSNVSDCQNYVKPLLVNENIIDIKNGSHPVVKEVLSDKYVKNDIIMNECVNTLLITGPNMAGKSTYMRSCALLIIMAQIGMYLPCDSATLKVFDKIYTRIGASDDLVSGESTFMVEMLEANNAIKGATKNSLILFDELGRGTATYDGMSLAESILEYVHDNIGCKTLFSTHYHELTKLERTLDKMKNIYVSANYENEKLNFHHKIKDGFIDKSYGLEVGKLAGLNHKIIERADDLLKNYENNNFNISNNKTIIKEKIIVDTQLEENIENLDINLLSPINALNELVKLQEYVKLKKENL
ncbi:MAG: DNA mismatch repair protein MutS [Bacilli bacterium]